MEKETASKINKSNQDTEWQSLEGEPVLEIISNLEEMERKFLRLFL